MGACEKLVIAVVNSKIEAPKATDIHLGALVVLRNIDLIPFLSLFVAPQWADCGFFAAPAVTRLGQGADAKYYLFVVPVLPIFPILPPFCVIESPAIIIVIFVSMGILWNMSAFA